MSVTAATSAPAWRALEFIVEFHTRGKKLGLLTETLGWVGAIALFRQTETETHYLGMPEHADRRQHKSVLASLIAQGERLVTRIETAGGLPENLDGISTADVEALVEELRMTHLQWYGDMTPARRAQILEELFNATPA